MLLLLLPLFSYVHNVKYRAFRLTAGVSKKLRESDSLRRGLKMDTGNVQGSLSSTTFTSMSSTRF